MPESEPGDDNFVDLAEAVPLLGQPMGEMRDAAQIDAPGVRRIAPTLQMIGICRQMGLQNAVRQPGEGLWLHVDLDDHEDLLSG
jgi:hypothetical protein